MSNFCVVVTCMMGKELIMLRLLAEHEGIEPLVMLLSDNNSQSRLYAARCVTEMSSHGKKYLSINNIFTVFVFIEFLRVQLITNSTVVEKLSCSLTFK